VGIAIVAVILLDDASSPAEEGPLDPNPTSSFRIVALGDSFSSGEGADRYFTGTDVARVNECHRAATAHPYLVADELGASLKFVACSGARTWHVTGRATDGTTLPGQHPNSRPGVFGGHPQIEVLRNLDVPDAVLISIGGNDAGFSEIGAACATPFLPDCRRSASFWLHRLDSAVHPALVRTFAEVRRAARGAPVFALTYPNPIGPQFCRRLVGVDREEMTFLRDLFVGRLNQVVAVAAAQARVRVIDLSATLAGHRLCEAQTEADEAVNLIELRRTDGSPVDLGRIGLLGRGSLHPNPLGHSLMKAPVRAELEALQAGRLKPLPPVPAPDQRPPPLDPAATRLAHPFPPRTRCAGEEIALVTPLPAEPGLRSVVLTGVEPGSTVCFRDEGGRWKSTQSDSDGAVRVPVDVGGDGPESVNEVLVQRPGGLWEKLVVFRLGAS